MSDALLLVSFGGPEGRDDVLPFLRRVTAGRDVPEARLVEVAEHYFHFGGRSPINDQNRALLSRLEPALAAAGLDLPLYWGNRNWHPLLANTMARIAADGHDRVVALATSAWSSYSGCREYREDLAAAVAEAGVDLEVAKVRPFHGHLGFVEAQADRVRVALSSRRWEAPPRLVFVAHAIPTAMAATSFYVAQVGAASARVVARLGRQLEFDVAWCSRSGPPRAPWTGPDVNDHLTALADTGSAGVVVVPIGFVSDHMEVAWDLDVEATRTANDLGLPLVRAGTVGTHPAFVEALVDVWVAAVRDEPRLDHGIGVGRDGACDEQCCVVAGARRRPVVAACK